MYDNYWENRGKPWEHDPGPPANLMSSTPPNLPVDAPESPRYILDGRVVTMNASFDVLGSGRVYVEAGRIAAVLPASAPPPPGMEDAPVIRTGDTIYPGLIELHNHLCYNILPLWQVPQAYTNRDQWRRHPDYRKLVSGPASILGSSAGYIEALVRYVEAKCLVAGVTTTQGVSLASNAGIRRYYRGIVRNVEQTDDPDLPEAATRIADVDARDAQKFLEALQRASTLLLHLSEGIDERARRHFLALQIGPDQWAITDALAGIHGCGLLGDDYATFRSREGSLIWSPLSNLLLYGHTLDLVRARDEGVLLALGSDWSLSGSKNLLGELKVARLVSEELGRQLALDGPVFTARDLVAMVTVNPAKILKWDRALGALEAGKRADLVVINGRGDDPYEHLIKARESGVTLVVINGTPRCGQRRLMRRFGQTHEDWRVGDSTRLLDLAQATADPLVAGVSLAAARDRLVDGLRRLPELAAKLENPLTAYAILGATAPGQPGSWVVELDQDGIDTFVDGPQLPFGVDRIATGVFSPVAAAEPLSQILVPLELDPLTVVDDDRFFERLAAQPNLPDYVKTGLASMYGKRLPRVAMGSRRMAAPDAVTEAPLERPMTLREFMASVGELSLEDRRLLVEQALILLEQAYVHLTLKRSMHAADPVQRLRLLRLRLEQIDEAAMEPELEFHREMTEILTSVRDLHTNYLLPAPFSEYTAFLPFLVEEFFDDDGVPHHLVSKVADGFQHPTFVAGVEILYWNGAPIRRAIEANAQRDAGSNADARFARGLASLTVRPLIRVLPPDEEWVTVTYQALDGARLEIRFAWQVRPAGLGFSVETDSGETVARSAALGFDLELDAVNQAKKALYAPKAREAERQMRRRPKPVQIGDALATTLPTVFRAKPVTTRQGTFAYVRIFTFNVPDADAFVNEFVRLVEALPQEGLIVDVRNNGGGLIYAAEQLLQVLTPHHIQPEPAQLLTTPFMLDVCRRHAPSPLDPSFDLGPWIPSIEQAVATGAVYSTGHPITPAEWANQVGQRYDGPVVLITDALCYSATDMFAAGFQDHAIGPLLGVGGNTGAGGANVWTHGLLHVLLEELGEHSPLKPLPRRAGMRVAVRRTLRVGPRAGTPLEDLGVRPDERHRLTRRDLLEGNVDLIEHAASILAQRPKHRLAVSASHVSRRKIRITITTRNIDRVDIAIDGRPRSSLDVKDGATRYEIASARPGGALELSGFKAGELVARRRLTL